MMGHDRKNQLLVSNLSPSDYSLGVGSNTRGDNVARRQENTATTIYQKRSTVFFAALNPDDGIFLQSLGLFEVPVLFTI